MGDGFSTIPEQAAEVETEAFTGLVCRRCRLTIADPEDRFIMDGLFRHRFINPAGFEFEIGCFSPVPGCSPVGEPTLKHTWFAGFAWSFAICNGCASHLGWFYRREANHFYGLILDQLLPRL